MNSSSANSASVTLQKPRFFYGWIVLPIAMLGSICTLPGQSVCIGAFKTSIEGDLSLTSSQFSAAYAGGTILASLLLPFVGAMMDRFGIRSAKIVIVCLLAGACWFISSANGLAWLLVAFFMLRLFGQGSLSLLANNSMAMWFHQHLGKVAGVSSVIVTFCFALSPLLVRSLIQSSGWRTTFCILGAGVAVIMLPLLAILFRNRPEDVGQVQDGHLPTSGSADIVSVARQVDLNVKQAIAHRSYAILLLIMTSWALVGTALIFDVQLFAASKQATRFAPEYASFMFFAGAAAMQLIGGVLADQYPLPRLIAASMGGMLTSIVLLLIGSGDLFFMAYGLFGVSQGLLVAVSATIWVRYYGRSHLGKIKGGAMMAMVAGSSIGPLLMGFAYDWTGGYLLPLLFYAALASACLIASLFLTSPQQKYAASEWCRN